MKSNRSENYWSIETVIPEERAIGGSSYWASIMDSTGQREIYSKKTAIAMFNKIKDKYGEGKLRLVKVSKTVINKN